MIKKIMTTLHIYSTITITSLRTRYTFYQDLVSLNIGSVHTSQDFMTQVNEANIDHHKFVNRKNCNFLKDWNGILFAGCEESEESESS